MSSSCCLKNNIDLCNNSNWSEFTSCSKKPFGSCGSIKNIPTELKQYCCDKSVKVVNNDGKWECSDSQPQPPDPSSCCLKNNIDLCNTSNWSEFTSCSKKPFGSCGEY